MAKLAATVQTLKASKHPLQEKTRFAGMPISIENKKGSTRSGVDAFGKPWSVKMPFDYGYIGRTKGPDGDAYDCFIGPNPSAKFAYVVHQCKQTDRDKWDEDKVMLGFDSADAAIRAYKSAYNNVDLFHSMTVMPMDVFKKKVAKTYGKKRHDKLHAGGPGSGRHKVMDALDEINEKFPQHPFNEKERYLPAQGKIGVSFELAERDGRLRLKGIHSSYPNSGLGSLAMKRITKIADKHGVTMELTATPYGGNEQNRISGDKLKEWYAQHGFKNEEGYDEALDYMVREPKTISAVNYGGDVGYDYRQFREGTAIQPLTNNHPPSLKNPIRVPSDNPDDKEDRYGDKKKRRSKATKKFYKELARRQPDKPEMAETTLFVPLSQG